MGVDGAGHWFVKHEIVSIREIDKLSTHRFDNFNLEDKTPEPVIAIDYQYMAICTDGDGVISSWKNSLDEANESGKQHEISTKGHRWTIMIREKP